MQNQSKREITFDTELKTALTILITSHLLFCPESSSSVELYTLRPQDLPVMGFVLYIKIC